jgi:cytochrome P450
MRFARLELKEAIATIAQQVSFEPSRPDQSPPPLAAGLSTHPTEPIELTVRHR